MDSLRDIQVEVHSDTHAWWDGDNAIADNLPHQAMALAGEVGELIKVIKKIQRKQLDISEPHVQTMLIDETVDCLYYVVGVANILNIDLGECYSIKRTINVERFAGSTESGSDRSTGDGALSVVPDSDGEGDGV